MLLNAKGTMGNGTLITAPSVPLAIGGASSSKEITNLEACTKIAKNARAVMGARQRGLSMAQLLRDVNELPVSEFTKEQNKQMIMEAYGKPQFSTSEIQQRVLQDFEDKWMRECMLKVR